LFSLAKGYVHRSLGPGTDRDGKGKAIIKKHRSSPSSFAHHAQRTLEKCVNVLFEHLIVTGDAEQRLTQSTVLKDGILLILFLN
jgi:hypothetical protein